MNEKKPPCSACGKRAKEWDGCARVECPTRRQVQAQRHHDPYTDPTIRIMGAGAFARIPVERDDE